MIKKFSSGDVNIVPFVVSDTITASSKKNMSVLLLQTDTQFDDYYVAEPVGSYTSLALLTEDSESYYIPEHTMSSASFYSSSAAVVEFVDYGAERHIIS